MSFSLCNQGCLKAHLPTDALIKCKAQEPPQNTIFGLVPNVSSIGYDDMMQYFPLVLALAELSPQCHMAALNVACHVCVCSMHACDNLAQSPVR